MISFQYAQISEKRMRGVQCCGEVSHDNMFAYGCSVYIAWLNGAMHKYFLLHDFYYKCFHRGRMQ